MGRLAEENLWRKRVSSSRFRKCRIMRVRARVWEVDNGGSDGDGDREEEVLA